MKNTMLKTAKRAICLLFAMAIICSLSLSAFADSPSKPVFNSQMPDCYLYMDSDPITLWSDVSVSDGGKIIYQWYQSSKNKISSIKAIGGAHSSTYTPPVKEGTVYYCLGAYNRWNDGQESDMVYSRMISVTYAQYVPLASDIEITQNPTKMKYKVGEKVDLKGLKVRIWTEDGYIDTKDGKDLTVSPKSFTKAGKQKVKLSYQEVSATFTVTVEDDHVHEFGEWEITTPATCKAEGEETRICQCGEKETRAVPKIDHIWDNGRIATQPTAQHDGIMVYTCRECGITRNEKIMFEESSSEITNGQTSETSIEPSSEPEIGKTDVQKPAMPKLPFGGMLMWILIGVGALAVIASIVIVVIVLVRKKK